MSVSLLFMTRERVTKPVIPLQRTPDAAPKTRVSSSPALLARLPVTLTAKPITPVQLELQRQQQFEVQRQVDLEGQRAAIQLAHDDRFTQARASQTAWHARGTKTLGVQRAIAEHARSARAARDTRAAFIAQRQPALLETLVAQRLENEVRPALPTVQRQADLTLSHVADHFGSKAAVQLARDPERLSSYAGFKNAGAGLVKNFRTPGSKHTIPELAKAIQRFRDPMQRAAVESAAYAAFGSHPTYPKQLQRALEERDAKLEVQRESWKSELESVAQRQALEEASGEGAAQMIEAARGNGQPLPVGVRAMLEAKWNTDLSKVMVHTDSRSSQISKKLNAKALTTGQDIFFGASTFNPTSLEGLQLIAHEAWHTVQQANGLVQAGVDKSQRLEVEAQGKGAELSSADLSSVSSATPRANHTVKSAAPRALLSAKAVQRNPQRSGATSPKKTASKGIPINRRGGVINEENGGGVNFRAKPDGNAPSRRLPVGTLFQVHQELDGGWYKVTVLGGGENGFVPKHLITLAPDKDAVLHQINAGQPAIKIAEQYYSGAVQRNGDLRFYVNILHHVNPDSIPNPSGDNWREAKTLKHYWIWVPSVAFAQTLRGQVKTGSITGGAYDAVRDSAEGMVKATIGQLPGGKQVLETIHNIGASASKVLNNPGAFVHNLGAAVNQGFTAFTAKLPQHLEASVVKLFTGTMGGIELPKTWDATGVLHVGLQMVGYSPQQLEQRLITAVPGGMAAINAAGEAKTAFAGIQKNGFAATAKQYYEGADLQATIIGGAKQYVINTVIKEGIKMLAGMFIPGAGIIQAAIKLYETIKFIWDKIKDLSATFEAITGSLADIAAGKIGSAAAKVTTSLIGILGLGVGFLARVAHLDGIAAWVKKQFDQIKKPIEGVIARVIAWFKGLVKGKGVRKPTTTPTSGAAPTTTKISDEPITDQIPVTGDKELHHVWAVIKNGQPMMLMASTPKEIIEHLKEFKEDARVKFVNNVLSEADFDAVSGCINRSGKDVSTGIALLKAELKAKPRSRNVTSTRARNLPGGKVTADPELNRIAVNTLTSVKRRMEVAFPILNGAGISVDNLKHAVSLAGGIVSFMKKIAAGETLSGISRVKLGELWNLRTNGKLEHRKELKDLFRSAASGKHEWIPTDLMLEVIDRDMAARNIGEVPRWIDLQHKFRIPSAQVVFGPNKAKTETFNGSDYAVFQGHVGSLYVEEQVSNRITGRTSTKFTEQTTHQMDFHNDLRDNFKSNSVIATVLSEIKNTVNTWLWDGKQMPGNPIHPKMRWKKDGNYLDVSKSPSLATFKTDCAAIRQRIMNTILPI